MSEENKKPVIGSIVWRDLTVPNAEEVKDFYCEVVGWKASLHPGCDDFNIHQADDEVMAGVCYAKGTNANVPPQWLVYVTVASVEESAAKCVEMGGKVLDGPRMMGANLFCVIQDPAGAVMGLIEG
ncbi:MAG: VOC family protein [Chitinophagales bacterium]